MKSELAWNEREPTGPVERTLRLLAFFGGDNRKATLSEIVRSMDMNAATTLRLLRNLEDAAFVQRDAERRYSPGPRLVHLGVLALRDLSIHDLARPHLAELAAETRETVGLGIPLENHVLYIDQVPSPQAIQFVTWVGRTVPMHETAIGQAILGKVGDAGYVIKRNTLEPDVTAIAVPIHAADGSIAGAINVTGPTYRMPVDAVMRIGDFLSHHAEALSRKLGARSAEEPGTRRRSSAG